LAIHAAREAGVSVAFHGGWEDAERVQPCFFPVGDEPVFTGVWMQAQWNARFAAVDHRALLGSLMALGMDRAFFGDIIALEDRAYLYVLPEMAARLPMEWNQAGRATLKVEELPHPPAIEPPRGREQRDTVASLRLDSVLASGMKISRARAAEIIRQGSVMVDHLPQERVDRLLAPGQLLSVRGFGRIRLMDVGEPTRKDRLPIVLEIFSKS
jgi:RNA-binding protein YlmH